MQGAYVIRDKSEAKDLCDSYRDDVDIDLEVVDIGEVLERIESLERKVRAIMCVLARDGICSVV